MTAKEFNEKWADFIEEGFTGLEINSPEVAEYLDNAFTVYTLGGGVTFEFSQVKIKFGLARVYSNAGAMKDAQWGIAIDHILKYVE